MNPLIDILYRNQGQTLTPELIGGILGSFDAALPEAVFTSVPGRELAVYRGTDDPRLVVDDRERVGTWLAQRVGHPQGKWGTFGAIGLLDRPGGELVAGALANNMTATNAETHVAFSGKFALKRILIYAFFDYVFNQLGLERVTGLVDANNTDALRFDFHLGYEHEFIIPKGNGGDVYQLVMWRDKCRWLKQGVKNG